MNDYYKQQEKLFQEMEERFKKGDSSISVVDPVENYETDNRICLTSISQIPNDVKEKIQDKLLKPLRKIDPDQYYYKPHSFHLSIQNVRVISNPPNFDEDIINKAKGAFEKVIPQFQQLTFDIQGLFQLPTNLALRAYTSPDFLKLAKTLRSELEKNGAPDDKLYGSDDVLAGSICAVRYYKKPSNEFLEKVKELKNINIGKMVVKDVILMATNGILEPSKTRIIETYRLHE